LRAYVGAGSIKIVQVPPQLTIDIENYGQTPATKVRVFNSWHTIPKGEKLPEDFSFPSKDQCPDALKSETTLYPHVPYGAVAETPACKEALLMIAQSVAGVSELYLYGHIDYRDIFDEPHKTTFCLEWTSGTSAYCGRHNEIDAKN